MTTRLPRFEADVDAAASCVATVDDAIAVASCSEEVGVVAATPTFGADKATLCGAETDHVASTSKADAAAAASTGAGTT